MNLNKLQLTLRNPHITNPLYLHSLVSSPSFVYRQSHSITIIFNSSSPPSSSKGEQHTNVMMEHRIQIPNIDPEQAEEYPSSPLTSQFQQPHTSPRRRYHPISDANPDTPPAAFINDHHYYNHNNHRMTTGVRFFRILGPRRDKCTLTFYAISILVIIGFFLIWWFTPRVAIKDAKMVEISSILKPFSLDDTEINLSRKAILAVATSPNPSIQLIMSVTDKADEDAYPMSNKQ